MTKFIQCRDELGSAKITVADDDLVSLALLGLPKCWHSYQDFVNGREKLPYWERLWLDLVQEEFRRNTRDGSSSKADDEENYALAGKAKKGKGKKSYSKFETSKEGKKRDMSRVRCFHYHEHGSYATNCPQKKKDKKASISAYGEALASQFEVEFSIITCIVSIAMG